MKKILFILLLVSFTSTAQFKTDTIKSSWYCKVVPFSIYEGSGLYKDRIAQDIEIGKSIGVLDIGLVYGKINQHIDSNQFAECRLSIDAAQYDKISTDFTIGFGKVFNSNTPLMLEISSTIFIQIGKIWGIGVVTGYYDFSGEKYGSNKNYVGLYIKLGLPRDNGGLLMNKKIHLNHRK